ncbi:MAG: AAA family ATPase, partial [Blastocatellia bacterium]
MSKRKFVVRKAEPPAIQRITVGGYKSISRAQSIDIRPLTILAGANSSGKSSIMQPLLLLKQTLEAAYNPGALLLDGANIKFTSAEQMFSRTDKGRRGNSFSIGLEDSSGNSITIYFTKPAKNGLAVRRMDFSGDGNEGSLRIDMPAEEIIEFLAEYVSVEDSLLEKIKPLFTVRI